MKPEKIFIIRHGESEGNVNKKIFVSKPDYAVMLTEKGIKQAKECGKKIKDIIQHEDYGVYYSPYFRSRQTMENAVNVMGDKNCLFKKEDPRIREQDYSGKLRSEEAFDSFEDERKEYGKFFYRLHGGESGADVYDRVSDFLSTLNRDFEKENYPMNALIFGHGMTNRLFLMRFFHFTVEEFETWKNPENGSIFVLKLDEYEKYQLITNIDTHETGYGYKYKI
jgi:broad specificity phosphatase PhoE